MVRVKISVCIIAAIIIAGAAGFFLLKRETEKLTREIGEIQELSDEGRLDEAIEAADRLLENWRSCHSAASVLVKNDKISAVQNVMVRIKPLLRHRDEGVEAEFESARSALNWIVESEVPKLTNIF